VTSCRATPGGFVFSYSCFHTAFGLLNTNGYLI
jgi:hypothetical protein